MVNDTVTNARIAERRLTLSYAPGPARAGLAALLALDDTLGQILRTTREPLVGQMRLTWWHDALTRLDLAPPPAEPVLTALAASALPAGVTGASLALMVEGWEALLEPLDETAIARAAAARGEPLFAGMAGVLGRSDSRLAAAGRGWAAADFARGLSDARLAAAARALARDALGQALAGRWPAPLRAIGALAHAALLDLDRPDWPPASPRRVARLLAHRLTGH